MPVGRRKPLEVAQRREQVADLYLQSWTQMAIAEHFGVAQSTISADLKAIQETWRQSAVRDFDSLRAIELQKLDRLEREAWAAWERSKKPHQAAVVREHSGQQSTHKTLQQRVGDPRYLDQINKCIIQRRALLGLDLILTAPETDTDDSVPLEVRRERVFTIMASLRDRERVAGTGTEPGAAEPGELRTIGQQRALEAGPPSALPE